MTKNDESDYPLGVETVSSAVITNDEGQVLLARSIKWDDLWLFPGGHVDPGESVFMAACREGLEEVGLELSAKQLIGVGELIDDPDFSRRAHLIYFHVWCSVIKGSIKVDKTEIAEARWFDIEEALRIVKTGDTTEQTLLSLQKQSAIEFDSRDYK